MYSIHNRDDLEKFKKLQETKSLLHKQRLKEKLGKQDFHYDMEEVFEPVTKNQKQNFSKQQELSEKKIQALRDSTREASQTTTQAIQDQTRAIRKSSNTMQKSIKKGIQEYAKQYDEITYRNNQLLTNLVNSNQVDSRIVKTVSNLINTQSQFSLEPIKGNPNLFTINTTMTFENGHSYDLNDPDLQYFITNTKIDTQLNNLGTIYKFLNDMNFGINYGDKKSMRYYFIKELINQYAYQQSQSLNNQLGSGLNGEASQIIFLPSDPDELVDQVKLIYFEKLGGNDNPQLNEQIIAIVDKQTTNQHQNMRSNLISSITQRISLWIKYLVIWIRFITNPVPTLIFIFQSIY